MTFNLVDLSNWMTFNNLAELSNWMTFNLAELCTKEKATVHFFSVKYGPQMVRLGLKVNVDSHACN